MDFTRLMGMLARAKREQDTASSAAQGPQVRCPSCQRRHGRREPCEVTVVTSVRGNVGRRRRGQPKNPSRQMFGARQGAERAWRRAFKGITPLWAIQAMHGVAHKPAAGGRIRPPKHGGRTNAAKKRERGWAKS